MGAHQKLEIYEKVEGRGRKKNEWVGDFEMGRLRAGEDFWG
jgi:hypothetical protein